MLQCLALHVCIFVCVGFFGLMCFIISVCLWPSAVLYALRGETERERGLWSSIELHWIPVMAGGGGDGREGEKRKRMEDKGGRCALKVLSQWDGWCRAAAFQPFRTQRSEPSSACSLSSKGAVLSLSLCQVSARSVYLFIYFPFIISLYLASFALHLRFTKGAIQGCHAPILSVGAPRTVLAYLGPLARKD